MSKHGFSKEENSTPSEDTHRLNPKIVPIWFQTLDRLI